MKNSNTVSKNADWIGRSERTSDYLTPSLIARFKSVLPYNATDADDEVPSGIHWCLAPIAETADRLGKDGHPALGTHLPPLPYQRRMWAGGALSFDKKPFAAGQQIERSSTIRSIEEKTGRTGSLAFVTVEHDYKTDGETILREKQTLVYRNPDPSAEQAPKPTSKLAETGMPVFRLTPDPVLLFRYSALSFNGHRIHYDDPYARDIEGYPGLVVHGPLVATILANLALKELGNLAHFEFRSHSPAIVGETLDFYLESGIEGIGLETATGEGRLIMTAFAS